MSKPTPEQREAALLVVRMDRDMGRKTNPRVLAVAQSRPDEREDKRTAGQV